MRRRKKANGKNNGKKKDVITGSHVVIVACALGVIAAVAMLISGFISGEYDTDFFMYLGILVACGVPLIISVQDLRKRKEPESEDGDKQS